MIAWPTPWNEVPPRALVLHTDGRTYEALHLPELGQALIMDIETKFCQVISAALTDVCLMYVPTEAEAVATLVVAFDGQIEIVNQSVSE